MIQNNSNGLNFTYISCFIFFIIFAFSYFEKKYENLTVVKFVYSNYNPVREMLSFEEIKNQFVKKCENFSGTYSNSNIYISRKFFRNMEFLVAETIIRCCYLISKTDDDYIKNTIRKKYNRILNNYLVIYNDDFYHNAVLSLQIRILNNLTKIYNIDYKTLLHISHLMKRDLKYPITGLAIKLINEYKFYDNTVFVNEYEFDKFCNMISKLKY